MTDLGQGGSSENRRKRLLFRAQRRGFKEVDLIFGQYAEAHLGRLDEAGLDQFEALLAAPTRAEAGPSLRRAKRRTAHDHKKNHQPTHTEIQKGEKNTWHSIKHSGRV